MLGNKHLDMKLISALILLLIASVPVFAAEPPEENQGIIAIEEKIRKQSQGLLGLLTFEKTNGQKAIVNGVELYTMECQVRVTANADCAMTDYSPRGWGGSFAAVPAKKTADQLEKFNPFGASYAGNNQVAKGAMQIFKVELKFDLTERGWHCEGILPPKLPDEKRIKQLLVGAWTDGKLTDVFGEDESWSRNGKKLGDWSLWRTAEFAQLGYFDRIEKPAPPRTLSSSTTRLSSSNTTAAGFNGCGGSTRSDA